MIQFLFLFVIVLFIIRYFSYLDPFVDVMFFYDDSLDIFFSTSAGAIATLTAIVFSISVVSLQNKNVNYDLDVVKVFLRSNHPKILIILAVCILMFSLIILLYKQFCLFFGLIVLLLLLVWSLSLYYYYTFASGLVTNRGLYNYLKNIILKNKDKDDNDLIGDLLLCNKKITIEDLSFQNTEYINDYYSVLAELYFSALNNKNTQLKNITLANYFDVFVYLLYSKHYLKNKLLSLEFSWYFEILWHEIQLKNKRSFSNVDFSFIETYFQNFFDPINRLIIDDENFDCFRKEIEDYSKSNAGNFSDRDSIYSKLVRENKGNELLEYPDSLIFESIRYLAETSKEIMIYNFEEINCVESKIDLNLEKSKQEASADIIPIIEKNKPILLDYFAEFYVHLRILKEFIIIGSYIIYRHEKDPELISKFLKPLWDVTDKGSNTNFLNDSPVTYNIKILSTLVLFGGKNESCWYHNSSINFDNFVVFEDYLFKYYVLFVTWIRNKKNKSDLNVSFNEEVNSELIINDVRLYSDFNGLKAGLIKICDEFKKSEGWNYLFDDPESAFEDTKDWLESCEKKYPEILSKIELDLDKVKEFKNSIVKAYYQESEVSKISKLDYNTEKKYDLEYNFCKATPQPHKFERGNFIADAYHAQCVIPDFVVSDMGKNIASCEFSNIVNKIQYDENLNASKEIINSLSDLEDIVCREYRNLKNKGYHPETLIIPSELFSKVPMNIINSTMGCDGELISVIPDYDLNNNWIYLIDPSSGLLDYKKADDGEMLTINVKDSDDKFSVLVDAYSEFSYKIVDSKGITKIEFSKNLIKQV